MATTTSDRRADGRGSGWAAGAVVFAALMLLVSGTLGILEGASAVAKDKIYVTTPNYVYQFSLTSWGWIHIVLGIIAIVVGGGLLADKTWARWAGVVIASLSLISQFLWLPYSPWWSIIVMALDAFVIWGLTSGRRVSDL
ncbi:DUF7144 family membrane protein [Streptacidiphilus jiangxiensis]|uniref:DUF7144 domain-containing protein n=1 Tax=Streptacidiphilus jiangxiensis TaxID=235985 RepID=A0A1H7HS80_STRJI|nr:hypothetical protein [Streptacidiphilus jiangxiensis]SEK53206.1 hypothetical protein SAMN05414137_102336 [Streptacidiphilus jiangxiensis]